MLTQTEILNEIFTLTVSEQREIVEKVSDNLGRKNGNAEKELSVEEKLAIVKRLGGSLKMKNPPMTREEEREIIYEHLSEKYK